MRNIESITRDAEDTTTKYKDGLNYHKQVGYQVEWPMYERFKAGDQWPTATEKTRSLPRPVFNIIDLIESLKVSTVMNEQIMMRYSTQDSGDDLSLEAADVFTRYSETVWEDIKQNELNEEMLEIAANVGTGILHYYWDSNYTGGNKIKFAGRMCGEVLDPINVFFGNPQERNVQKQPYVIISYRDMLWNVRKEAQQNGLSKTLRSFINGDEAKVDEGYDSAQVEVSGTEKVTVLLHYYKEGDRVFFKKVASGITFKQATDTNMSLYPLAVLQWKRRRKSIHGVGDTKGLIPNQRAINFLIAMSILSAQLTGWPKLAIDPQRVVKSKITNTPGEVVEVKDAATLGINNAIQFLNPGQISGHVNDLVGQIVDLTRSMTSANEASTGEAPGANMSAAAIIQLQKANGVPIESVKRRFYQCMEDVGRIWEEFFKVKYNMTREVKVKDDEGEDAFTDFHGTKYADTDLSLKIDVGPSSQYSEALMMASLDNFLERQYISFDQYLKYAPSNVVPFKERLIREMEKIRAEQAAQTVTDPISAIPPEQQAKFAQLPPDQQQRILQQARQMGQGGMGNAGVG
ncbi:portal protein [Paenibacillus koleovorans]